MTRTKVKWLIMAAIVLWGGVIASAPASAFCPAGDSYQLQQTLKGLYNFTFASLNEEPSGPLVVGTGTFTLDGLGNVTAGTVKVNCGDQETFTIESGSCYAVNTDGSGIMSLVFSTEPDHHICDDPDAEAGIDLDLTINSTGIHFISDASDFNFNTGQLLPLAGIANGTTALILPPLTPVPLVGLFLEDAAKAITG